LRRGDTKPQTFLSKQVYQEFFPSSNTLRMMLSESSLRVRLYRRIFEQLRLLFCCHETRIVNENLNQNCTKFFGTIIYYITKTNFTKRFGKGSVSNFLNNCTLNNPLCRLHPLTPLNPIGLIWLAL